MSEIDINSASKEIQELYNNDPDFHYYVRAGAHAEDIILAMAKRKKELTDEIIDLTTKCTCHIGPFLIKDIVNNPTERK